MNHHKLLVVAGLLAVSGVLAVNQSTQARGMNGGREGMGQQQRQLADERKAEIKQRIEAKRAEIKQRLADKKAEICLKRQDKINQIVDRGIEQNTKQLAVFQKIEERVQQFYENKALSADDYQAAVDEADAREAAAVAALEAASETDFDCEAADAVKPGLVIREAMTVRHQALKDYRTAVKDLILVVKHALGGEQATDEHDHDDHEHDEATGSTDADQPVSQEVR